MINDDAKIAYDAGRPLRTTQFPSVFNASGRTFGDEEVAAVTRVLRSGQLGSTGLLVNAGSRVRKVRAAIRQSDGRTS